MKTWANALFCMKSKGKIQIFCYLYVTMLWFYKMTLTPHANSPPSVKMHIYFISFFSASAELQNEVKEQGKNHHVCLQLFLTTRYLRRLQLQFPTPPLFPQQLVSTPLSSASCSSSVSWPVHPSATSWTGEWRSVKRRTQTQRQSRGVSSCWRCCLLQVSSSLEQ